MRTEALNRIPGDTSDEEYSFLGIDDVWIDLRAELGNKTLSFGALLNLDVGGILQLGRPTGENVDLLAGDVRLASGEILIIDTVLAVRVADLNDPDSDDKAKRRA